MIGWFTKGLASACCNANAADRFPFIYLYTAAMSKDGRTFTFNDELGERTLSIPDSETLWVGNPIPIVRDIEARTRTRLCNLGNPVWFIRLHRHFSDRRDPADRITFAEYVTRRHSDEIAVLASSIHPSQDAAIHSAKHGKSVKVAVTVQPVHFEDFSGFQFERLVFAYLLCTRQWQTLEWYGQSGSDLGRDIWGELSTGGSVCVQCVNRKVTTSSKIIADLDKIALSWNGLPTIYVIVCASKISAKLRDKLKDHTESRGISQCEIWSGHEFEERLRNDAEGLLRRFVEGVPFPDEADQLRVFAASKSASDSSFLKMLMRVFDRPAFRTPIQRKSSLPDFKQAITDTIQALNTGIWQTRNGKEIDRLPSRHDLASASLREMLATIVDDLIQLRACFDDLLKTGDIRLCSCGDPCCPTLLFSDSAARQLDSLRSKLLETVRRLHIAEDVPSDSRGSQIIVSNSFNSGIIANQVTIHGNAGKRPVVVADSMVTDASKYNYVEFLIKRLTEFRDTAPSFGQQRPGRANLGATRKIRERQLGGLSKDLPVSRFEEIVNFLKTKIDNTALGRNRRAHGEPNYHSFDNHPGKT